MVEWLVEHPVLWNKKMKDNKDIQMKDALWREQAEKMDKDANEMKVWRLKKMPSGSGAPEFSDRDKWILQKLEFLRPYIVVVPKRTTVSVSIFFFCLSSFLSFMNINSLTQKSEKMCFSTFCMQPDSCFFFFFVISVTCENGSPTAK